MMVAAKPFSRADRARIRAMVAGLAVTLSALVMMLLAVIATAPASRLNADRDRMMERQATVITENLAASFISPQASRVATGHPDGPIEPSPSELAKALKTYRQLASIMVVSEEWQIIASVGLDSAAQVRQIRALRALPQDRFPPTADDITTASLQGQTITAGRILEGAGRGGPLIILGFAIESEGEISRVLLYTWGGLTMMSLLIWGTLDLILRHLLFAPVLLVTRHHNITRLGNWTQRVHCEGILEIQRYASLYNSALDRAARLWSTIAWRRRHLETHAPEKSAEADRAVALLSSRYQFSATSSPAEATQRIPSIVPIALLVISEFGALLASLYAYGNDSGSVDPNFSWHVATVLMCTGIGLAAGSIVSRQPQSQHQYRVRLVGVSLLFATAHLSGALLMPGFAAAALPRIVSGFCVAVACDLWMYRALSTWRPPFSWNRIALNRVLFVVVFTVLSPCVIYGALSHSHRESLTAASGIAFLIAMFEGWALLASRERTAVNTTEIRPAPDPFNMTQLAYAVPVTAIAVICLMTISTLELDDSGRYISLVMFFIAISAGISVPFSLGAKGILLALLCGALCAAPGIYAYYLVDASPVSLLHIAVSPAISLIAGSCIGFLALTIPEQAISADARGGPSQAMNARMRFVFQSVGLGCIVAAVAAMTELTVSSTVLAIGLILVSVIAIASSRLRTQRRVRQ